MRPSSATVFAGQIPNIGPPIGSCSARWNRERPIHCGSSAAASRAQSVNWKPVTHTRHREANAMTKSLVALLLAIPIAVRSGRAAELKSALPTGPTVDIMGSPVSTNAYQYLKDQRFLPTRPEMTDFELAEKLNLDLPPMAEV